MDVVRAVPTRSSSSPVITTAIVDGDPLARQALRARLDAERDMEVVGEAPDASTGIELIRAQRPDLVLIDRGLRGRSGGEAMGEMLTISPQTRVIMLAVDADEDAQMHALRAGAAGYLLKSIDLEVLPRVLRGVLAGEAAVTRALGTRVLELVKVLSAAEVNRLRPVRSSLTEREWQVLDLVVEHATTGEIARRLRVSPATVRTHVKHILKKLGMHSRDEAIRYVKRTRAAS
jgi:NarL family two-component system response regulator LiaR